jgi:hypothetical protein
MPVPRLLDDRSKMQQGIRCLLLDGYREVFVDYPGFLAETEQYQFLKGLISGAFRHLVDPANRLNGFTRDILLIFIF